MIGMTEAEFWASTPRYFAARQKAYIENQRREYERARFTGWLSVLPHVTKKGGLRITQLFRFDWEEKPQAQFEPVDVAAMKQFEDEAKKIFEQQFGIKFNQQASANGHYQ